MVGLLGTAFGGEGGCYFRALLRGLENEGRWQCQWQTQNHKRHAGNNFGVCREEVSKQEVSKQEASNQGGSNQEVSQQDVSKQEVSKQEVSKQEEIQTRQRA